MESSKKGMIGMLVGRPAMAIQVIKDFLRVSQIARESRFVLYALPGVLKDSQVAVFNSLSPNIEVSTVGFPLPRFDKSEMFWSRKSGYAKNFGKNRLGYLDMCFWRLNMFDEEALQGHEYMLMVDDDVQIIGDPDTAILEAFEEKSWAIASAGLWNHVKPSTLQTRETLFEFLQAFIRRWEVTPADDELRKSLNDSNPAAFHALPWSVGNFNLYRLGSFKGITWERWVRSINLYGGPHRFRWCDIETLGIYARLEFPESLRNLGLIDGGLYSPKRAEATLVRSGTRLFGRPPGT